MYILNPLMYVDLEDNNLIITLPQKDPVVIEEDADIILNILELFIHPSDITTIYNKIITKFPLNKRKFRNIIDDMINLNFIKMVKNQEIHDEFETKYSRQLNLFSNLESINENDALEIQQKIINSSVLVIGVGGVGTYVCNSLVRMGVENIAIIDYDIIEDSNLSRQSLYYSNDIGKHKVNVAQENLRKINPSANIKFFNKEIKNTDDLSSIANKVKPDIIVCCADKPRGEIQIIVDQVSQKYNIAWILGGPHGLDKVSIGPLFIPQETKSYLEIFGYPKSIKSLKNINNNMISAVIDPFNGIAGLLISTEIIKYLTNYQEPCIKILALFLILWIGAQVNMNCNFDKYPIIFRENGYFILERFSSDYDFYISREEEFKMQIALNKKIKKNILLIGNPGTGKTTLVNQFAINNNLNIYCLEAHKIIGDSKYRGEFEQRVTDLLDLAIEYKLIIFIDEIQALMNLGKSDGGIGMNDILKPYLTDSRIDFIGATTKKEAKNFLVDEAFNRRFSKIVLSEFNLTMLKNIYHHFINKYNPKGNILNDDEFNYIYKELDVKLPNKYFPDKWIDFIDFFYSLNSFGKFSIREGMDLYINDNK